MTCYQRHLGSLFEELGLEYDKPQRKRVDAALKEIFGLGDDARCPEVWAHIKALSPQEREGLTGRVADAL